MESTAIDFAKPIRTRGGSEVKIYEVFNARYINGAYYSTDDDIWYPVQWSYDGTYGFKKSALDLVNVRLIATKKK